MIATHNTTSTTLDYNAMPQLAQERLGEVTNFRKLHSAIFSRISIALKIVQWIVDMEQLLEATYISNEDRLNTIRIQLTDIAKSWWLTEEPNWTNL